MNPILIVLRLFVPLIILRWPFFGGVVAIILDNIDWSTKYLFGIDPVFSYQETDKILDTYYLALLAISVFWWRNKFAKYFTLGLFIYRFIGFILFETIHLRVFLIIFPNVFENFFFAYLLTQALLTTKFSFSLLYIKNILKNLGRKLKNDIAIPKVYLGSLFVLVLIPKLLQEYQIHIIKRDVVVIFGGFRYVYEDTSHQIIFILIVSAIIAYLLKKRKA